MITKLANVILDTAKSGIRATAAPLGVGMAAMDIGSGASVPQAVMGGTAGFIGFEGGGRLAKNLVSRIPKVGKWGWLGNTAGFLGGMVGSMPAYLAGRKAGEFVPGFKHKQLT